MGEISFKDRYDKLMAKKSRRKGTIRVDVDDPSYQGTLGLQKMLVHLYHERNIALRKQVDCSVGLFKRGVKGGTLSEFALDKVPDKARVVLERAINEKGAILCHLNGWIFTLPQKYFRYSK